MPVAALIALILLTAVWLVAIAAAWRAVAISTDHRLLRILLLGLVTASLPSWHFAIEPWLSKSRQARQIASAARGDEAAAQTFAAACTNDGAVVIQSMLGESSHVDIAVTEQENFMYELRHIVGMYVRRDDQPCVGQTCQLQIAQTSSDSTAMTPDRHAVLTIGKAQILGEGRIRRYEMVLSHGQQVLGRASIYRLSRFAPPSKPDTFCPNPRDQLKSLLQRTLPAQFPANAG